MALGLRKLLLSTAACACMTVPALAANCVAHNERQDLEVRVIQTELMVAALTCGESDRYNSFVTSFKGDLTGAYQGIKRTFRRIYRGRAVSQLDSFDTQMANASSQRSNKDKAKFCQNAAYLFDNTLGKSGRDMVSFVRTQPLGDSHGYSACSAKPLVKLAALKERDGATTHPLLFGTESKQTQVLPVVEVAAAAPVAEDSGEEDGGGIGGRITGIFGGGGGSDVALRPVRGGGAP